MAVEWAPHARPRPRGDAAPAEARDTDASNSFDYRNLTPADIEATATAALAAAEGVVADAVAAAERDTATFAEVVGRLDQALGDLWDANGRSGFMVRVHPDEAVRAVAQAADEQVTAWRRALPLRDDVAGAVARYAATPDAARLGPEESRLLEHWQRDLRRAGHGLEVAARDELRDLTRRAVALEVAFQRNVDEWDDGIDVTLDDLVGLPPSYVASLRPGSTPGTLRVSLDYPEYFPFIKGSPRRDLRELLTRKRAVRAVEANRPILEELLDVRRRHAQVLGYPSWAHFRIEPKMAGTPERVAAFHASLFPAIQALATQEYAVMRRMLEADTGERDLQVWDVDYYDHRIRATEHAVDPDEVSSYLVLEAVLDGLFRLCEEVFGLRFVAASEARAWHPDVGRFDVVDATTDERLGSFYTDLHPRPGKFGHAMAYPVALPRRGADGRRQGGISAIVANVPRSTPGEPSARLRHDDVEMLFHEFGHVLHEVLGTNRYFGLSMSDLEDDFPEAVSQIMEHWAWSPSILARISRHHDTGAPMPLDLAERVAASRTVDLGTTFLASFCVPGDFDLRVHGPEPVDLEAAKVAADAVRGLPTIDDTFWPAGFAHLAGGYDAGYYGYLWSCVYGDDLWSRFAAEGLTDPDVGAAYRREILEPGASRDAEDLVEAFLGRPSTDEAFLRRTGLGASAARAAG